jgi:hypothetical protein
MSIRGGAAYLQGGLLAIGIHCSHYGSPERGSDEPVAIVHTLLRNIRVGTWQ